MQSGFFYVRSHFNSESTVKALRRASFRNSAFWYYPKLTHLSAKAYRFSNARFLRSYKRFALSKRSPVARCHGCIEVGSRFQTASSNILQGEAEEGEENDSSLI